jgi:hypothetical protein
MAFHRREHQGLRIGTDVFVEVSLERLDEWRRNRYSPVASGLRLLEYDVTAREFDGLLLDPQLPVQQVDPLPTKAR